MRITVDLAKASTEPIDLTKTLNPRVGDGDLKLPFHIIYDQADYDMQGKSMDFLSEGSDQKKIYVSGTTDESTTGDDAYTGNVTFTFPTGTFKTAGTYDVDKTMFRIVDNEGNVISSVNVKMTVLPNDADVASTADLSYDSRAEKVIDDFKQKGQSSLDDAKKQAQQLIDDAKQQATDYLDNTKKQGDALLDEIKQTNAEAKGNVSGDTAATATQAKQQAIDNSGKIHDLQGEVGDARGRFMTLSDRENKQDFNIDRKEDKDNANANYAAQDLRNDQQDKEIAKKANQSFITDYLSEMSMEPEAFTNVDTLKAKYPNGKAGIMVTVDTGHKWIWDNNQWNDAGIYQGVGIADRSIAAKMLKQFDTNYRVVQAEPIVVDWDKHQIMITKNISFMEGQVIYDLPVGTFNLDDKTEVSTIYCGFNVSRQQFDFIQNYDHISDLPTDDYFIGIFDEYSRTVSSLFKFTEATSTWKDGTKTLIQNKLLPPLQQAICTAVDNDIHIDFTKRTLTLYTTLHLYSKTHDLTVDPSTINLNAEGLASFIYVIWSDTGNKYVLDSVPKITDVPENSWYLGWIDYYRKSSYFNQVGTNSTAKIKHANLTMAGKITVDFDTREIVFPRNFDGLDFDFKLSRDYQNPFRVQLKSTAGLTDNNSVYYIAVDPRNADHFAISSDYADITYNCELIGWVSLSLHYYDFGEYGNSTSLALMPFTGKKVTCLGDSITSGGQTDNGGQAISYTWYLEYLIGTNPINAGISGSHITKGTPNRTDSFTERVDTIKNQDLVTIYGGVNDFLFDSPLGTMADDATTQTTFYGALKYLVTRLTFNNPDAKLLFITPMKADKYGGTYDVNGNVRKNNVNATEEDYVNAIKEVAGYYSIPVLDLFHAGNLNPYIPAQKDMTVDGLHPNEKGAKRLADTIAHAINNL